MTKSSWMIVLFESSTFFLIFYLILLITEKGRLLFVYFSFSITVFALSILKLLLGAVRYIYI